MKNSWRKNYSYTFRIILFLFIQHSTISSFAQSSGTQIIPLSPNAAEFNRYSSVPVNGMTGIPEISFPIYEINTGKLKVPISLSYHAGGIRVKQRATWVGLGWSLNAGGVISRAIRGKADEDPNNGWYNDPVNWNVLEQLRNQNAGGNPTEAANAYNTMANQWVLNPGHDTHADFFSYIAGDRSGKFIFSRQYQKFTPLPFEPIRINYDVNTNTYKITDDQGIVYHYEAKETTMYFLNYPVGEQEKVQSWYLSRIVSADGTETIQFNYELIGAMTNPPEIVETFSRTYKRRDGDLNPQVSEIIRTESPVYNSVQVLKEIIFPQGKVVFIANTTRLDYSGKALDSIVVYSKKDGQYYQVNKHSFSYDYFHISGGTQAPDYRLRLKSFQKDGLSGELPLKHAFSYNPDPLPRTDSYAADYWGFYNGASGNSTYLANTLPPQPGLQQSGAVGNASRAPNASFMEAGMLKKITYPTGGYTEFNFEPHQYKTINPSLQTLELAYFKLFGTGMTQQVIKQQNFQVPASAATPQMSYTIKFSPFVPGGEGIPQQVQLKDLTAGTTIKTWEHTDNGLVTQTYTESYNFDPTHQYQFYAMVQNHVSTFIEVTINYKKIDQSTIIKAAAGHRVSEVIAYEVNGAVKSKEVYKYGDNEDGIGKLITPEEHMFNNFYSKGYVENTGSNPQGLCCPKAFGELTVFVGVNTYSSFSFMGSNILYNKVTIYPMADGIPNGKTIQEYRIPNSFTMLYNPGTPGGYEFLDYSLFGQQLEKQTTFSYDQGTNSYNPIEEKVITYRAYNVGGEPGVRLWEQFSYVFNSSCMQDRIVCFGATISRDFGYNTYSIETGCYRVESVTTRSTDKQGNVMTVIKNYEYNNPDHLYATNVVTSNSRNEVIRSTTYYPGDHTGADPNNSTLNKMVSLNMLQLPYWEGEYRGGSLKKYKATTYSNQLNGNQDMVKPQRVEDFVNKGTPVLESFTQIKAIDVNGNPLLINASTGLKKAYIWDYLGMYPVAEVTNATNDQIAYTSFEYEGLGGWSLKPGALVKADAVAVTGNKVLEGGITKSVPTGNYTIGIWTYGNPTINGQLISQPPVRTINSWRYYEVKLSNISSVDITGDKIDEVRLHPQNAQMATYTYEPLVGMKSQADPSGRVVYYEYDGLGRLTVVRDQDKSVIRKLEYQNHLQ